MGGRRKNFTHHFQPRPGQTLGIISDGQDPLSTLPVSRILPQRMDAFLEEVIVGILLYLVRFLNVVVNLPKLLNLKNNNTTINNPTHYFFLLV